MARRMRNRTALLTGVGAAVAAGLGYLLSRRLMSRDEDNYDEPQAAALSGSGAHGGVGSSGNIRPAGPEAMRDPPGRWSQVDEASDESFPASDPPAVKHVD